LLEQNCLKIWDENLLSASQNRHLAEVAGSEAAEVHALASEEEAAAEHGGRPAPHGLGEDGVQPEGARVEDAIRDADVQPLRSPVALKRSEELLQVFAQMFGEQILELFKGL
jgi:hypothetical protein